MITGWLVVNAFLQSHKFDEIYDWLKKASLIEEIELVLKTTSELLCIVDESFVDNELQLPEFVLFWDKDTYLARWFEKKGVRLFNSANAIAICDDKALTHLTLSLANIKQPKTIIAPKTFGNIGYTNLTFVEHAAAKLKFPMVIKECFGSFGMQVHLAHDEEEAKSIVASFEGRPFLMQEFIESSKGRDIRINVVGGKVVSSMLRISKGEEFRSNLTIGGTFATYEATKAQKELAIKACEEIGLDFGGVDVMFGDGEEPVLCEVNSNAHFKTTFDCTGVNMAEKIMQHVKQKLGKVESETVQPLNAFLIYRSEDAIKNAGYIKMYFEEGEKRGIHFELIIREELSFGIANGKHYISYQNNSIQAPDFVVMRAVDLLLSRQFEALNIPVYNNSTVAEYCNNKLMTHQYLAKHQIKMVDTVFVTKEIAYSKPPFAFPIVVKPASSHGGNNVFLVKEEEEFLRALSAIQGDDIVLQRPAKEIGKDLRVYVIGKQIVAAILRSSDKEFRSNYSLGGKAEVIELSKKQSQMVNQIIELFDFGLVGIDFLFDGEELLLNEIEDVVGARMLYANTNINLVGRYLDYIICEVGSNHQ